MVNSCYQKKSTDPSVSLFTHKNLCFLAKFTSSDRGTLLAIHQEGGPQKPSTKRHVFTTLPLVRNTLSNLTNIWGIWRISCPFCFVFYSGKAIMLELFRAPLGNCEAKSWGWNLSWEWRWGVVRGTGKKSLDFNHIVELSNQPWDCSFSRHLVKESVNNCIT